MNPVSEVKRIAKGPWLYLAAGILLGGTVLAAVIGKMVAKVKVGTGTGSLSDYIKANGG